MKTMYDNTKKSRLTNTTMENNQSYEPKIKTSRKPFIHPETGAKMGEEIRTTYKICTNDCISKQRIISFLEDKIKQNEKRLEQFCYEERGYSYCEGIDDVLEEVLDFVNKGGKE